MFLGAIVAGLGCRGYAEGLSAGAKARGAQDACGGSGEADAARARGNAETGEIMSERAGTWSGAWRSIAAVGEQGGGACWNNRCRSESGRARGENGSAADRAAVVAPESGCVEE